MPEKSQSRKITVTSENAKDVMVESMVLRKLEITFGGRDLRAGRMDPASISSVRSDLFRERSKSRREDLAVGVVGWRWHTFRIQLLTTRIGQIQLQCF